MQFRYAFELAYNGSNYHGWQRQPNASSVQETLETALRKLTSGEPVEVVGCGRTDTGVHASYYVLHVDLLRKMDEQNLVYKLNKMLPDSIVLYTIREVSEAFHARFSAISRKYRYFVHTQKNPFLQHSLYLPVIPDFDKMNLATHHFIGTKDFTSLSKLHTDVKTNVCTVTQAAWKESDSGFYFEIEADRFLRNMVRATVGTLLDVGYGRIFPEDVKKVLEQQDRGAAGKSVPAHGLFLVDIRYPSDLFTRNV